MANFYNPYQNRTTAQPAAKSAIPGVQAGADPNAGSVYNNANANDNFGNLHVNQLGSDQWGTGASFQGAARVAGLNAIKNSMSTANPEDYAGMDEMRNYYRGALADLPGNTAGNISSFDTQSQRGLSNMLSQYKNANAGKGTLGSRQYAGAQGDIVSRANGDYLNGLLKARSDSVDQAGKIGTGLTGVQNQNLVERKFQTEQGQALADMIMKYMNMDQSREVNLSQIQAEKDAANQKFWNDLTMAGVGAATKAATGPTMPATGPTKPPVT
jgi:hypothetical protein